MTTAETLAKSISLENKGIYLLTWDEKEDLVHAIVILIGALECKVEHYFLSDPKEAEKDLLRLFGIQPCRNNENIKENEIKIPDRDFLLMIFIQQAVNRTIGPILNGWRNALSQRPGTILIIRSADLIDFQRNAPDLASFIGPKLYDSSSMLSIWEKGTIDKVNIEFSSKLSNIFNSLPGDNPKKHELKAWIDEHPAIILGNANDE